MIKKLKLKFLLIFMSITTLTLVGVFVFIVASTYQSLEKNCKNSLSHQIAERPMDKKMDTPPDIGEQKKKEEAPNTFIVLTVKYSNSNRIIDKQVNESLYTLSDEETEALLSACLSQNKEYGKLRDYGYAYMVRNTNSERIVSFYDLSENQRTLGNLIMTLCLAGILAIIALYFISLFLSSWCVRPIERSLQQQQDFVADASHELKTPLTVILANVSLLNSPKGTIAKERTKYLSYIEDEANHMSRLVNDMLFLAKTDAKRVEQNKEPVDLSDVCMNSALSFESVAYEKDIQMNYDIQPEIFVSGMSDKLSQLCAILLDNACKYTDANGTITIQLNTRGTTARLSVNNTGSPISKEQLPHLFERFYRVDEARTRTNSGYGLGLSIAWQIVSMHSGKIEVQSSEQQGTTFVVKLPCISAPDSHQK